MLFCVPWKRRSSKKSPKSRQPLAGQVLLGADQDYETWRQLFEAAKRRKGVTSAPRRDTLTISLFLDTHCPASSTASTLDTFLDKYCLTEEYNLATEEVPATAAPNLSNNNNSCSSNSRESFEETVSWQYFDISDSSSSTSSSSSEDPTYESFSLSSETSDLSFRPATPNCSTLKSSFFSTFKHKTAL